MDTFPAKRTPSLKNWLASDVYCYYMKASHMNAIRFTGTYYEAANVTLERY